MKNARVYLNSKYLLTSVISFIFMYMILHYVFSIDILKSFLISALSTMLNHFLLPSTLKFGAKNLLSSIKFEPTIGEKIYLNSGATHFKGFEGVGGKLFLTGKRLIFKSHKLNVQNHEEEFDLLQIENIEISNGKRFNFEYQGKLEKFIVDSPKEWVKQLELF